MAASTRSSSVSTSSGSTAFGSIFTERNSPDAVIVTVTSPPPAVPVTSVSASSAWAVGELLLHLLGLLHELLQVGLSPWPHGALLRSGNWQFRA